MHFDTDGLALYALVASGLEQELLPSTHRVFKVRHGNTALLRNREEPLTPLVGEFELTLIQDLDAELRRSGVIVEDLGDLIRFVVRLMFDEPRRGVQGVGIVDYASYTEYLYRTWLLSERRRFPLPREVEPLTRTSEPRSCSGYQGSPSPAPASRLPGL